MLYQGIKTALFSLSPSPTEQFFESFDHVGLPASLLACND